MEVALNMSKNYYILSIDGENMEEISEYIYYSVIGDRVHDNYASKVYGNQIAIDEVPEELRSKVAEIVTNRINRWGSNFEPQISSSEFQSMLDAVL